ncbi:MAG TPA: ATPase, partial [Candidatus Melainabacteria bacterium]|nr:ATPase [Candidatus Melainabacteria bacterium]
GVSGSQTLRTVLAQMDPKQQALVLGYAVPMPVVVRTRSFDTEFYQAVGGRTDSASEDPGYVKEKAREAREELFGP